MTHYLLIYYVPNRRYALKYPFENQGKLCLFAYIFNALLKKTTFLFRKFTSKTVFVNQYVYQITDYIKTET